MDKYLIIKNGLVLTLDNEDRAGYYNIVIKNNLIHQIDFTNDLSNDRNIYVKYPGVSIIDAKNKIIIPSLFNSSINSAYSLSGLFFERLNYDKLQDNLSLVLLDKYFSSAENRNDLKNLVIFTYFRALSNGELFLNDVSEYISKEFLQEYHKYNFLIVQDIIFTAFNDTFSRYLSDAKKFHFIGLRDESNITNYTLSSAAKALKEGRKKIYFEILNKSNSQELIKNTFSKSLFRILGENDFLDHRFIFTNPVYISRDELEYISAKNTNIVLCPTDMCRLGEKKLENLEILKYGFPLSIGTGYLGASVLKELKLLSVIIKKGSLSYKGLLRMAISNPAKLFEVSHLLGSIEKNKIANLILFDLSDLRNYYTSPEINAEKISEHIIDKLDEKDISDIIVKGNVIRRDYRSKLFDIDLMNQNTSVLINKIIETGKYYEFKEKYLMRKRIKEISTGNPESRKIIITESNEIIPESENSIISDSEFRIIGIKKEQLPVDTMESDNTIIYDKTIDEVENINEGIKFFDESEMQLDGLNKNTQILDTPKKRIFFDDTGIIEESKNENSEINAGINIIEPDIAEQEQNKNIQFKKDKMRFGFPDENEQEL